MRNWSQQIYCQTKTPEGKHHITRATQINIWNPNWNKEDSQQLYYNPILLYCQLPTNQHHNCKLSLSTKPCTINEVTLKAKDSHEANSFGKNSVTVCVKPLKFPDKDITEHLMQWIEINRVLGANKFEVYVDKVNAKVWKVLQWYKTTFAGSFVIRTYECISDLHEPSLDYFKGNGNKRIWQKRRCELLPYNDCLYHNLQSSNFVVPIDIDEVIVPRQVRTWQQLLDQIATVDHYASFSVRNAYYLSFFTKKGASDVFFFKDYVRSEFSEPTESGKSFVSTRKTLTVFNHYALHVLRPETRACYFLSPELVQMNHYKDECAIRLLLECAKYLRSGVRIVDSVIFKYRKQFEVRYAEVMEKVRKILHPIGAIT